MSKQRYLKVCIVKKHCHYSMGGTFAAYYLSHPISYNPKSTGITHIYAIQFWIITCMLNDLLVCDLAIGKDAAVTDICGEVM